MNEINQADDASDVPLESIPLPSLIYDPVNRRILEANRAAARVSEYTIAELRKKSLSDLAPRDDAMLLRAAIATVSGTSDFRGPFRLLAKSGAIIDVEVAGSDIVSGGRNARLVLIRPKRFGNVQPLVAVHAASRGIGEVPLLVWTTDRHLRIATSVSALATGFAPAVDGVGVPLGERVAHAEGGADALRAHRTALEGHAAQYEIVLGTGHYRCFVDALREPSGEIVGVIGLAIEISESVNLRQQLAYLARHDPLTGLPNRTLLAERLTGAIAASRRRSRHVAVVVVDIDDFKRINDNYGHGEGDRIIQTCAERLRASMRAGDVVARTGADEFVVVLSDLKACAGATHGVERMRSALAEAVTLGDLAIPLTASFGISCSPEDGDASEQLIGFADMAMHQAKEKRRGNFVFYEPALQEAATERMRLEHELRNAIRDRALTVHYQPIIDAATGRVEGVEALARWPRPDGLLAPAGFIPLAEETGLIVPLGELILREACCTIARLHRNGYPEFRLAVNLSPRQLNDEGLPQLVRSILDETGMPPRLLDLEITESFLVTDPQRAASLLAELSALGIRIALDDFGTGYSALSFLRQFPVHLLKLDRSFVRDIEQHRTGRAIAATIIDLARTLGMRSLAEGVETPAQYSALSELGCEAFQGFHFARPMPADALETFLAEQR